MRAPADANLDELKKKARRRLVGAIVLALAAAVFVPMLLESDERPLGDDVSVRIPAVDQGKFVNRLNSPTPAAGKPANVPAHRSDATPGPAGAAVADASAPNDSAPTPGDGAPADAATGATSAAAASAATNAKSLHDAEHRVLATPGAAARPAMGASDPAVPASVAKADSAASPAAPHAEPAAPAPRVVAKAATPVKAAHGGFDVQLAAFSDDKGANALVNRLKRSGHPAFTEPVTTSRGTLWRVRVGPYASHEQAVAARDKLKREGQNGIVAARNS